MQPSLMDRLRALTKLQLAGLVAGGLVVLSIFSRELVGGLLITLGAFCLLIVLPVSGLGFLFGRRLFAEHLEVSKRAGKTMLGSLGVAVLSFGLGSMLLPASPPGEEVAATPSPEVTEAQVPKRSGAQSFRVALALGQNRQFGDAIIALEAIDPNDAMYEQARAKISQYEGLLKVAAKAESTARFNEALALGRKKQFEEAITAFEAFSSDDPNYDKAQAKIVQYQRYLEEAKRAEERAALQNEIQMAKASGLRLRQIAKSPDSHVGEYVAWRGRIMSIEEGDGKTFAQISYYENGMTMDNFFTYLDGSIDVYADDHVVVYGKFFQMKEYQSQANYNLVSPVIEAVAIRKIAPLSMF